ncbi:MAG TPA: L-threonylcarbamoyladenylate synthase [Gammaproteobacteria bacterium]
MAEVSELSYSPRLDRAARIVADGGVIAYPTEAVYGMGCLPGDRNAIQRILRIKRRSWRKGLILIAADLDQLTELIVLPASRLREEILASWPGPVTWVLEAQHGVPAWLGGGTGTLAVRVTDHPLARRLCERVGEALVSTSANRGGRPPLTRPLSVRRELGHELDDILVGPLGSLDKPTMVRDGRTGAVLR